MATYWEWTRKDYQRLRYFGDWGGKDEEEDQNQLSKGHYGRKEERAVNINNLKATEQAAASSEKWRILVPALCAMFDTGR